MGIHVQPSVYNLLQNIDFYPHGETDALLDLQLVWRGK